MSSYLLNHIFILLISTEYLESCITTSPVVVKASVVAKSPVVVTTPLVVTTPAVVTSSAATSECSSCLLSATTIINVSAGTKAFTSDTIDTSGTCAIRTSVCDGNRADSNVLVSYNNDDSGVDAGVGSVTSILTCNTAGQWVKEGVVILHIECQST